MSLSELEQRKIRERAAEIVAQVVLDHPSIRMGVAREHIAGHSLSYAVNQICPPERFDSQDVDLYSVVERALGIELSHGLSPGHDDRQFFDTTDGLMYGAYELVERYQIGTGVHAFVANAKAGEFFYPEGPANNFTRIICLAVEYRPDERKESDESKPADPDDIAQEGLADVMQTLSRAPGPGVHYPLSGDGDG